MRNPALEPLGVLVGEWALTVTDAWFLESRDVRQRGRATVRWLGDSFLELDAELEGEQVWHFVFGRSDANEQLVALYHDPRPTSRLFQMTLAGSDWTLHREDPDFHQRFVASMGDDRIEGRWEASEDHGATWRKDFDLIFERTATTADGPRTPTRPGEGASDSASPAAAVLGSAGADGPGRRADTASRVIAVPPERVFAALVDREALAAWLPPEGMTATFEHFEPRPGGSYRLTLTYVDDSGARGKATADSDIVEARYLEIEPGARVVQAVDFLTDDPAFAGTMTMTWRVTAVDEGTRVDIVAEDVPDGISAEDHAAGLASTLANLAGYVER
ncbi:MAG TPA: SRPBCC family protein [Acidimicrobiales bacterium]|nr:SRPBCC family protein [Acidimicrobiales bacterium]